MRQNVMELYNMEDLLPIVEQLVKRYTSCGSSSVTYERARYLMEAVIYCINHFYEDDENSGFLPFQPVPAKQAYEKGYENIIQKVKKVQKSYNELMMYFCHYGNKNYGDTVYKALPAFFMYYNPRLAPAENIITMDYPVFGLNMELCGIDMIEQYLNAIIEEQKYLLKYEESFVVEKLRQFHPNYEKEFFNVREILELQNNK